MGQNKSKQGGKFAYTDKGRGAAPKPYLGSQLDRFNAQSGASRVGGPRPAGGGTNRPSQRPPPRNYNSGGGYNSNSYSSYKSGKTNGKSSKYGGYSGARQGQLGGALPLDPADDREKTSQMSSQAPRQGYSKYGSSQRPAYNSNHQSYAQRQIKNSRPNKPPSSLPSYSAKQFRESNSKSSSAYTRSTYKPSSKSYSSSKYKSQTGASKYSSYSRANPKTSKPGAAKTPLGSPPHAGAARPKASKPSYKPSYSKASAYGKGLVASTTANSGNNAAFPRGPASAKSASYAADRSNVSKYAGSRTHNTQPVINEDQALSIPEKDDALGPSTKKPGFAMDKKMCIDDFVFLKVVGKGSFGKVMQVRYKKDGKIYAMKVLKKKALVKRKQVIHTRTERRVVAAVNNPFIVSLRFAFQTQAKLYMILDFFNGGELFFHLKKEGRFSERRAKFYGAEITSALGALHALNIVYRDLKPENILLDQDGHIKITDFGLSKDSIEADELTHTFCGTPEYLAPEVLQQQGHGKAVDWWSFGTLLYEMMTGLPPFYNQNLNIMYEKILHAQIKMPTYLSKESRSLFRGLLERNPSKRLASGPGDADEIKVHPYFRDIDWPKLESRGVKPPHKPPVANERQTHMFEPEFTDLTPKDTPVVTSASMLKAQGAFPGFTYDHVKDTSAFSEES